MSLNLKTETKFSINLCLYAIIFLTLVVSNNLNSIVIVIFIIFNLITFPRKALFNVLLDKLVLITMSIFLLYIIGFFLSENKTQAAKILERSLSYILLPSAIFSSIYQQSKLKLNIIFKYYIYIISTLLALSFLIALYKNYTFNLDQGFPLLKFKSWFFTYHYIAANVNISAIYLSLFTSLAVVLLMLDVTGKENLNLKISQKLKWALLLVLIIFIFLLSARTILVSTSLVVYFFIFKYLRSNNKIIIFIVGSIVLFFGLTLVVFYNDVLRLRVLSAFQFYDDAKYFTGGLSSRAYQWMSIFEEFFNNNIYFGVGTGDIYDKYLIAYERYNLDWAVENRFNSHNMYIESLFSTGILGLTTFLLMFFYSLKMAIKRRNRTHLIFLILFFSAGVTESLLSRQYGIIYFLLFNSLFYFSKKHETE